MPINPNGTGSRRRGTRTARVSAKAKLRMHKDGGRTFIARDEIVRYARACDGYGA